MASTSISTSDCMLAHVAYAKLMLHVAKHPSEPCLGLLLGRLQPEEENRFVYVVDAVPVFHHYPTAAPLEAALNMVDAYCAEQNSKAGEDKMEVNHCR